MARTANDRKSVLMMVSSLLIFGTIGIFRRWIPFSSALLTFSRGMLGGLFLLLFARLKNRGARVRLPSRVLLRLVLSGAAIGINWILLFEAYNHTTVAVATLCYYMQPTIVMLLSPVIFQEKLTGRQWLCAAVAIAGMVLVSGVVGSGTPAGNARGVLLGLGAAVFYAVVVIMNKKLPGIDVYQKTTVQLLSAGAVMLPYLLLTGEFLPREVTWTSLLLLLVVCVVHTGLAYVLYFGSMDGLKAQSIALFGYIDPVSALLFSALLLHEPISSMSLLGAVMIIGSAVLSEMQPSRKQLPGPDGSGKR